MIWIALGGAVNVSLAGVLLYLIFMRLRPAIAPSLEAPPAPPAKTADALAKPADNSKQALVAKPAVAAKPQQPEANTRTAAE